MTPDEHPAPRQGPRLGGAAGSYPTRLPQRLRHMSWNALAKLAVSAERPPDHLLSGDILRKCLPRSVGYGYRAQPLPPNGHRTGVQAEGSDASHCHDNAPGISAHALADVLHTEGSAMTSPTQHPLSAMSEEKILDLACSLALTELGPLLEWACSSPEAPSFIEATISQLGIPEPDLADDGHPIPGSRVRKLLHWSHVEQVVQRLTRDHHALSELTVLAVG